MTNLRRRALAPSYQWWRPVVVASIVALAAAGLIATSTAAGKAPVVAIILILWAAFCTSRLILSRAMIETDGRHLRVRRLRAWHELEGRTVTGVREAPSIRGPNYRVCTESEPRGVLVPCALLNGGHSTLFNWLLTYAPAAELDRGARRTLDHLRQRGLIEDVGR